MKILLDAGHGGKDSGAVGNGLYEKNLTLEIVKRLERILKGTYQNIEVMLSRTDDTFLSLDERTKKANMWGADVVLSIHINSAVNPSAKGYEDFVYLKADAPTKALQNVLHDEITRAISAYHVTDRGKKSADFHMLRMTKMKAVLTENLFISNSADTGLLKQSVFLDKLALGHAIGLERFFGLKKIIRPPSPVASAPKETASTQPIAEELYQVITGTFRERKNADALAEKLKNEGYNAYVDRK